MPGDEDVLTGDIKAKITWGQYILLIRHNSCQKKQTLKAYFCNMAALSLVYSPIKLDYLSLSPPNTASFYNL